MLQTTLKISSKVALVALWAIVGAWILLVLLMVGLRLSGGSPTVVLTDSMSPTFSSGDLVVLQQQSDLRPGQVRAFVAPVRGNPLVIHRIVGPGEVPNSWQTKGDANATADPWSISSADFRGEVDTVVPYVGRTVMFIASPWGRVLLLGLPIALLGLVLLMGALTKRRSADGDPSPPTRQRSQLIVGGIAVTGILLVVGVAVTTSAPRGWAAFTTTATVRANSLSAGYFAEAVPSTQPTPSSSLSPAVPELSASPAPSDSESPEVESPADPTEIAPTEIAPSEATEPTPGETLAASH